MTDVETGRRIGEVHRAQRIRDIVAQQWQALQWCITMFQAVAVSEKRSPFDEDGGLLPACRASPDEVVCEIGCDLRSAVDIVDGVA